MAVPVADFTATPLSLVPSTTVTFTDASTNTPTVWAWNFGDGGSSSSQNPTHVYVASGIYTVTLTASNVDGSNVKTRTGYITVTSTWLFTGPGYQEFLLPVNVATTTVTVQVRRDSAYSPYPGGTLPSLQILANGRIGIPNQTIVDTGSAAAWNTLTAAAFTPTAIGWVTVRITSYDGTGTSIVTFDTVTVT